MVGEEHTTKRILRASHATGSVGHHHASLISTMGASVPMRSSGPSFMVPSTNRSHPGTDPEDQ